MCIILCENVANHVIGCYISCSAEQSATSCARHLPAPPASCVHHLPAPQPAVCTTFLPPCQLCAPPSCPPSQLCAPPPAPQPAVYAMSIVSTRSKSFRGCNYCTKELFDDVSLGHLQEVRDGGVHLPVAGLQHRAYNLLVQGGEHLLQLGDILLPHNGPLRLKALWLWLRHCMGKVSYHRNNPTDCSHIDCYMYTHSMIADCLPTLEMGDT